MGYVPYKGTGALMGDLLSGRLQAGIDKVAILTPYIQRGELRGIAVTGATPSPLLPELPTIASSGMPGFEATGWFGVYTSVKVQPMVRSALRDALRATMATTEVREKLVVMGAEPKNGGADELRALFNRETTIWSKVIRDSGIALQ